MRMKQLTFLAALLLLILSCASAPADSRRVLVLDPMWHDPMTVPRLQAALNWQGAYALVGDDESKSALTAPQTHAETAAQRCCRIAASVRADLIAIVQPRENYSLSTTQPAAGADNAANVFVGVRVYEVTTAACLADEDIPEGTAAADVVCDAIEHAGGKLDALATGKLICVGIENGATDATVDPSVSHSGIAVLVQRALVNNPGLGVYENPQMREAKHFAPPAPPETTSTVYYDLPEAARILAIQLSASKGGLEATVAIKDRNEVLLQSLATISASDPVSLAAAIGSEAATALGVTPVADSFPPNQREAMARRLYLESRWQTRVPQRDFERFEAAHALSPGNLQYNAMAACALTSDLQNMQSVNAGFDRLTSILPAICALDPGTRASTIDQIDTFGMAAMEVFVMHQNNMRFNYAPRRMEWNDPQKYQALWSAVRHYRMDVEQPAMLATVHDAGSFVDYTTYLHSLLGDLRCGLSGDSNPFTADALKLMQQWAPLSRQYHPVLSELDQQMLIDLSTQFQGGSFASQRSRSPIVQPLVHRKLDDTDVAREKQMFATMRSLPDPLASVDADFGDAVLDVFSQQMDVEESVQRMEAFDQAELKLLTAPPAGAADDYQLNCAKILILSRDVSGTNDPFSQKMIMSWIESTHAVNSNILKLIAPLFVDRAIALVSSPSTTVHGEDRQALLTELAAMQAQHVPTDPADTGKATPWARVRILTDVLLAKEGPELVLAPCIHGDDVYAVNLCDAPGQSGDAAHQSIQFFRYSAVGGAAPLGSVAIAWHEPGPLLSLVDKFEQRRDLVVSTCLGDHDYFLAGRFCDGVNHVWRFPLGGAPAALVDPQPPSEHIAAVAWLEQSLYVGYSDGTILTKPLDGGSWKPITSPPLWTQNSETAGRLFGLHYLVADARRHRLLLIAEHTDDQRSGLWSLGAGNDARLLLQLYTNGGRWIARGTTPNQDALVFWINGNATVFDLARDVVRKPFNDVAVSDTGTVDMRAIDQTGDGSRPVRNWYGAAPYGLIDGMLWFSLGRVAGDGSSPEQFRPLRPTNMRELHPQCFALQKPGEVLAADEYGLFLLSTRSTESADAGSMSAYQFEVARQQQTIDAQAYRNAQSAFSPAVSTPASVPTTPPIFAAAWQAPHLLLNAADNKYEKILQVGSDGSAFYAAVQGVTPDHHLFVQLLRLSPDHPPQALGRRVSSEISFVGSPLGRNGGYNNGGSPGGPWVATIGEGFCVVGSPRGSILAFPLDGGRPMPIDEPTRGQQVTSLAVLDGVIYATEQSFGAFPPTSALLRFDLKTGQEQTINLGMFTDGPSSAATAPTAGVRRPFVLLGALTADRPRHRILMLARWRGTAGFDGGLVELDPKTLALQPIFRCDLFRSGIASPAFTTIVSSSTDRLLIQDMNSLTSFDLTSDKAYPPLADVPGEPESVLGARAHTPGLPQPGPTASTRPADASGAVWLNVTSNGRHYLPVNGSLWNTAGRLRPDGHSFEPLDSGHAHGGGPYPFLAQLAPGDKNSPLLIGDDSVLWQVTPLTAHP
jgi:hypothetical protein